MNNKPQVPMFRLPMKLESKLSYAAAKAAWEGSMIRVGLLTQSNILKEKNVI